MNNIYVQMASGKEIQKPSDDPIIASKSLKFQFILNDIDQYLNNANDAKSWMEISENALDGIKDIINATKELSLQAANDTMTDEDKMMLNEQVTQMLSQLIEVGNTNYAGSYIFAGYDVNQQPFSDEATNLGPPLLNYNDMTSGDGGIFYETSDDSAILDYYGSLESIGEEDMDENIIYHISTDGYVDINVEGYEIFDKDTNIYNTLTQFQMYLNGEEVYKRVDSSVDPPIVETVEIDIDEIISDLDTELSDIVTLIAGTGSKIAYTELAIARLDADYFTYTSLLSETEDVDIAKASMDLASAEVVYEASLSVGAKIIQPTLVDFIK